MVYTFSVPCCSDSPSCGDSRVHPSPLFQSQPLRSTFSSVSSVPIKGFHSRGISPLPQDINSPDVIDLTRDSSSPQSPDDHDHTYSSTYSTLPPTTAVTPPLWSSPLVKRENLSGRVEFGQSPTRSFFYDQKTTQHSQLQQTSYPHGQLTNASMMQKSPASPLMGRLHQQQCSSYPTRRPSNLVPTQAPQSTTVIASQFSTVPPSSSVPVNHVRSPDVIGLTQDSLPPRPRNYCDRTCSHTHSVLPSVSTVAPQPWYSPLVKHENLSGHVELGQSPTRSFFCDQRITQHSQFQQTSYPHGQLTNASMMQKSPASPLMGCLNMHQQQQRSSSSFMMTYPTGHPSNLVPTRATQSATVIASQLSTVPPSSSVLVNRVRSPYLIDLTQDSLPPRPRNYCDLTQFRIPHAVLPSVSTICSQPWSSPLVKQESLSGHATSSLGLWQSPTVCHDQELTSLHRQLQHAPYPHGQLLMNRFRMQKSGASPFMGNPQSQQLYLCPSVSPFRYPLRYPSDSVLIPQTAQSNNIMTPLYQPSTVPPSFPVSPIHNPSSEQQRPQEPWTHHPLASSYQPRNPEQQPSMSNLHWNLASLQSFPNQSSHIPQSSSEN